MFKYLQNIVYLNVWAKIESRVLTHKEKNEFDRKGNITGRVKLIANYHLSRYTIKRSIHARGLSVASRANAYSLHTLGPIRMADLSPRYVATIE